jgi:serine/threonine-protein kinase RsbW
VTDATGSSSSLPFSTPLSASTVQDTVTLTIPAEGSYLALLRMVTAGLAVRLDFNVDEIEDLKIAVDEACAMLLAQALPGIDVRVSFAVDNDTLAIEVSVPTTNGEEPSRDTFSWTVLTALAGEVDARVDLDNVVAVTLRKSRSGTE